MTTEEKAKVFAMVDDLEKQVGSLIASFGNSREWSLAVTKMEESAMWMRRAIERS